MNLEKTTIYGVCLCLFFLTFQIEITNATLIILVLLNLGNIFFSKSFPIKHITINGLIFIGLFLLQVISLLYSKNIDEGIKQLERQLLLVVIPLLFLFVPPKKENLLLFKRVFFWGGVFSVVYAIIASIFVSKLFTLLISPEPLDTAYIIQKFTYHELAHHVGGHALYFANYLSFSCIVGLALYFTESNQQRKKLYMIGIILQIIAIFLLKSVTIILGFIICFLIILFVFIDTKKVKNKIYLSITSSIIFTVLTHVFILKSRYYYNNSFSSYEVITFYLPALVIGIFIPLIAIFIFQQKRWIIVLCTITLLIGSISSLVIYSKSHPSFLNYTNNYNNINSRYGTGLAAFLSIKEHPILGVGVGDTQEELMKLYKTINFHVAFTAKYNEHNQYLRYWLSSGILTLLLYFLLIGYNITRGIQNNDYTLICLSILLSLFSLTESCLIRQKGMLFFVVLFSIYDLFYKKEIISSFLTKKTKKS